MNRTFLAVAAAVMFSANSATAAPTAQGFTLTTDTATWTDWSNNEVTGSDFNGLSTSAFGVSDGTLLPDRNDAYDDAFGFGVNGQGVNDDDGILDVTGSPSTGYRIVVDAVVPAGFAAQLEYFVYADPALIRAYFSITNTGATTEAAAIAFASDVGSDTNTNILDTGSGDTTLNAADEFVISDDTVNGPAGNDPVVSFNFFGDGKQVMPTSTGLFGLDDFNTLFDLTLNPGETQALLLFGGISASLEDAQILVEDLESLSTLEVAGYLDGLTPEQIAAIVNYGTPSATTPAVPEPSALSLFGAGLLGLAWAGRRRRKAGKA